MRPPPYRRASFALFQNTFENGFLHLCGAPELQARRRSALPLVDLSQYRCKGTPAYLLARCKGRLFPSTKEPLFGRTLELTRDQGDVPDFVLNRGTALAEQRKRDKTVFLQVKKALFRESRRPTLRAVKSAGTGKQAWVATFQGEGGSDHGGLFRDSIREICGELQAPGGGTLKLLVECPNQRLAMGANQVPPAAVPPRPRAPSGGALLSHAAPWQDKWAPNPAALSPQSLTEFRAIGMLLGASVRTQV